MRILGCLILLVLISCGRGVSFNPDIYVTDYQNSRIVNEDGIAVYADEIRFNDFACMSSEKWKELKTILQNNCNVSNAKANELIKMVDKIYKIESDVLFDEETITPVDSGN